jgi:hypothetical protein
MAHKPYPASDIASEELGRAVYDVTFGLWGKKADWTLNKVGLLEHELAQYSLGPRVTDGAQREQIIREMNIGLAAYHEALPFDEAERRWISNIAVTVATDPKHRFYLHTAEPFVKTLTASEATLLSAGVFRTVKGDELYQRWREWKTTTGEFEDTRAFRVACRGLLSVCALLQPDRMLPPGLVKLTSTLRTP